MIGICCFTYAFLHLLVFVVLDLNLEWQWLLVEIAEKPYLAVGLAAFIPLVPMAMSSNSTGIRLLGKAWRPLHRLIYPVALLAALHYIWLSKNPVFDAWVYLAIVLVLLGDRWLVRLGFARRQPIDDDLEVPERGD